MTACGLPDKAAVTRFARSSRNRSQLVEMCRVITLLIDQKALSRAAKGNGNLLLGLKGSLNWNELDLLRPRPLAERNEKARQGALLVVVEVGKDPDRRVQEAIRLAIHKLTDPGSVRRALPWFRGPGWICRRA